MKRSSKAKELVMEVAVGAFMFVVLLSLGFFTIILSRENIFKKTYPLEVIFEDVMELRDGDNVVMRGMIIGKVKDLVLKDDGVHVIAALARPVSLRRDYKVGIIATSVLGGRYMQIHEGTKSAEPLPPHTPLKGETPVDFMTAAASIVDDFKQIADKINSGKGTLGKLINDEGLYDDARAVVGEIKTAVTERGLLQNIEESVANLKDISAKINEGKGAIGQLINDPEVYQEVKKTLKDARVLMDDLRETSSIVTFSSIFFGAF